MSINRLGSRLATFEGFVESCRRSRDPSSWPIARDWMLENELTPAELWQLWCFHDLTAGDLALFVRYCAESIGREADWPWADVLTIDQPEPNGTRAWRAWRAWQKRHHVEYNPTVPSLENCLLARRRATDPLASKEATAADLRAHRRGEPVPADVFAVEYQRFALLGRKRLAVILNFYPLPNWLLQI